MIQILRLFYVFLKIGFFSFGGGYAMLSLIYQELSGFGLSNREFSDLVALSQMTPGPIAVNAATYIGFETEGILGSIFATIGVSVPSFVLIYIISTYYNKYKSNKVIQSVLDGIRPATVGMIASAVIFFAETSIYNKELFGEMFTKPFQFISIPAIVIFAVTIIGSERFKINPIILTVLAGVLGAIIM